MTALRVARPLTGHALAGATVQLVLQAAPGTGARSVDATGVHRTTQSVRAPIGEDGRHAAYGVPVQASAGSGPQTTTPQVTAISGASVSVYAAYKRSDSEFAKRMRQGFGRYITAADVEQRGALTVGDALTTVPGLRVGANASNGRPLILGRGGYTPAVYLDGVRVENGAAEIGNLVSPAEVGGIEVYVDPTTAPARYSHGNCADVLVWTKGGMR